MLCAFDSHDFVMPGLYTESPAMCRKCGAVWEAPTSEHGPQIIPATVQVTATPETYTPGAATSLIDTAGRPRAMAPCDRIGSGTGGSHR